MWCYFCVNHILQDFYTLFMTRFRTYKIASSPLTKMTSKDAIKGLVSLKGLSHEIDFKNFDKNLQNLA
jgi:hypothetical protein